MTKRNLILLITFMMIPVSYYYAGVDTGAFVAALLVMAYIENRAQK